MLQLQFDLAAFWENCILLYDVIAYVMMYIGRICVALQSSETLSKMISCVQEYGNLNF